MSLRTEFIKTPLEEVMSEGFSVSNCLKTAGIESYPALDYILSSLFLRMTGFSEQKLRSIHWELATLDLDTRYSMIKGDEGKYGEYSNLEKKKDFYTFMKKISQKLCYIAIQWGDNERQSILDYVKVVIEELLNNSIFSIAYTNDVKASIAFVKTWTIDDFLSDDHFMSQSLTDVYDNHLYKQRNNSAHNTLSYQKDNIQLSELKKDGSQRNNFFTYFALLILLDTIFTRAYDKIIQSLKVY